MENSKQYLKTHNIVSRISFKDSKEHIVELLNDKIDKIIDKEGNEKEGVKYSVKEDDELKSFFTSSIGLISKLAEMNDNDIVAIKLERKKTDEGYRSSFSVRKIGKSEGGGEIKKDISDDDIPVIESQKEPLANNNQ